MFLRYFSEETLVDYLVSQPVVNVGSTCYFSYSIMFCVFPSSKKIWPSVNLLLM